MELITTVYIVRHGETEANVTNTLQGQSDVPLNAKGVQQAQLVGRRLRSKPFDVIWSSDLSRAAVTAREIAGEREITYTPLLREWDLGDWVGLTWSEIAEKYPAEAKEFNAGTPDAAVPGGESRRQFHDRAAKILETLISEYPGKTVLCVSHGGVLRAMFHTLFRPQCKQVRTDNTCICCFKHFHATGNWQLVTWNDTAHLDAEALSSGW